MIYILSHDIKEIPKLLDDKSLNTMIKDVAQVLCNVHWKILDFEHYELDIPLDWSKKAFNEECIWTQWASKCKANYLYLVELLYECLMEYRYRISGHKCYKILCWARDNVPDLSIKTMSNLNCPKIQIEYRDHCPITVPKKYQVMRLNSSQYGYDPKISIVESYREWYKSKLKGKVNVWTNRPIPDWINDDMEE